ncbi:aspartate tyrosine aromatic aminotransferase [Levilactobacillus senmaizukei DSM 21775 = NBRC 103853]|uniref:Aminotransferase n=1 Tax=Levilactobacillus senmaizukei DSM 21775 = NBRC 103853 TaxID=1423803 RepID=A0A0R2DKI9_9LACO|nr:pyridoxal phosphate-dependent aminotransferase [Levilactobacillus senmaizukei]KRN02229.1 aspartate tyrosine aromatic aminotransferase [Levilactobacillus senmaizukei DSM 21775 = NBRC 103853]
MQISKRAQAVQPSATFATAQKADAMQATGVDVINLCIGQPDFPTPRNIKDATVDAIRADSVDGYTATPGIIPLRQAVIDHIVAPQGETGFTADQVVVTTGAKMAFYALFQAILDPGDDVLIPAPYWVSYGEQVRLAGGQPIEIAPTSTFKVTPDQLAAALTPQTRAVVLNSPQNPSGVVYTRAELKAIGEWAVAHDLLVIADEIYGELLYDGNTPAPSMLGIDPTITANVVVINGVSKTYAMTGWRIGFLIGQPAVVGAVNKVLSHMTGNTAAVSQAAALAALTGDQSAVTTMRAAFKERLDTIYPLLMAIPGFDLPLKPQGAFYLFPEVTQAMAQKHCATSAEFADLLLNEAHVAVVSGEAFGLANHIRLSYATDLATLKRAMQRINTFMQE